uniref:ALOG domain-containing protein n=1 Tax=Nelumbo nucifera TaxID=4432 RepID=A0A822Y513_NELNU|nr:TPA_asm: hypothetical protein HUJ06_027784 [Nelumbo nucifera]
MERTPGGASEPNSGEGPSATGGGGAEGSSAAPLSRYESQKRRDCAHVIEFLKYLDQFGKTKVHLTGCAYFGHPNPPAPCACPLKQAWGSLDALIGRLRAAYEENGGRPESNPFGARAVRIFLREVREGQAKARGIPYEKKRKRPTTTTTTMPANVSSAMTQAVDGGGGGSSSEAGAASVPPATTSV